MSVPLFYSPITNPRAEFVAKTFQGLEQCLADELLALGAEDVSILKRAVQFSGDRRMLYRANYELRTALRILAPIHYFYAPTEDHYYDALRDFRWQQWLDLDTTFVIDVVTRSEKLTHSHYLALKAKDAIVDFFRDRFDARPSIDIQRPDVRIHIYLDSENNCTVLLDSSGESLHVRGYRRTQVAAPISEVLAAGMLDLVSWDTETQPLYDPMCGSGTILIEGYLKARKIPPQRWRTYFGFETWPDFDAALWQEVRSTADAKQIKLQQPIWGSDIEMRAIEATKSNLYDMGLAGEIKVRRGMFEHIDTPPQVGLMLTNPPYDERLARTDINALYANIGTRLKHHYPGWQAWMISSNAEAIKHIGLRPSRKIHLFNGPLECRLLGFSLYDGTKRYGQNTTTTEP